MFKNMLVFLPSSSTLTYWWNGGSFLGFTLVAQVFSGLLLLLNYNSLEGYDSVIFIIFEVGFGWALKIFHSNNASLIFVLLYFHLYKNTSVFGYRNSGTWNTGIIMMLLIMGAAFSGYVLVSSHMSLWAAMVITSLLSVIPINGEKLLFAVWGGYSITWVTYQTLLVLHFILPFLVLGVMLAHLNLLHLSGSTGPLLVHSGMGKVSFYPYFWVKDTLNLVGFWVFMIICYLYPYALGEVELYEEANPMNSPMHIVPEWYFCAQYAILRSVPNKGMGVVLMLASILVLFCYPSSISYISPPSSLSSIIFFELLFTQVWLSYLGGAAIAQPYVIVAQISVLIYFVVHLVSMSANLIGTYVFEV